MVDHHLPQWPCRASCFNQPLDLKGHNDETDETDETKEDVRIQLVKEPNLWSFLVIFGHVWSFLVIFGHCSKLEAFD